MSARACRVCGCTDSAACMDPETGETCAWSRIPGMCTFCADALSASRAAFERGLLAPGEDDEDAPLVVLASDADANAAIRAMRSGS